MPEHGLLELATAPGEICLLGDCLGRRCGNAFLICTQQCRKLSVMHLSLENPCIFLNFCFVALKFVMSVQAPRTRAVKNVRRHACSSIIKMCRDYPQLVLVCKCNCIMKSLASISAGFCGIFSFFGYSLCFSSKKHSCCANGKVVYPLHLPSSPPHP